MNNDGLSHRWAFTYTEIFMFTCVITLCKIFNACRHFVLNLRGCIFISHVHVISAFPIRTLTYGYPVTAAALRDNCLLSRKHLMNKETNLRDIWQTFPNRGWGLYFLCSFYCSYINTNIKFTHVTIFFVCLPTIFSKILTVYSYLFFPSYLKCIYIFENLSERASNWSFKRSGAFWTCKYSYFCIILKLFGPYK